MMMATCNPVSWASPAALEPNPSKVLLIAKLSSEPNTSKASHWDNDSAFRRLQNRFHVIQVLIERLPAGWRERVLGLGHATLKRLATPDVLRFFEFPGVDA